MLVWRGTNRLNFRRALKVWRKVCRCRLVERILKKFRILQNIFEEFQQKLTTENPQISFTFVAVYLPLHWSLFHVERLKLLVHIAQQSRFNKHLTNDAKQPDESNRSANCEEETIKLLKNFRLELKSVSTTLMQHVSYVVGVPGFVNSAKSFLLATFDIFFFQKTRQRKSKLLCIIDKGFK